VVTLPESVVGYPVAGSSVMSTVQAPRDCPGPATRVSWVTETPAPTGPSDRPSEVWRTPAWM
jgi:hypothetical protein